MPSRIREDITNWDILENQVLETHSFIYRAPADRPAFKPYVRILGRRKQILSGIEN